jgi:hypothetical protein
MGEGRRKVISTGKKGRRTNVCAVVFLFPGVPLHSTPG